MVLEGLVLQVIPQKERDLVARLLLREGTLAGVYVYGGMGGGKHSKPRLFEPGNMLKVEARSPKNGAQADLFTAGEHHLVWRPAHMRHDARAFALACLMLEMTLKTAVPFHPGDAEGHGEHEGAFKVLSNALFHLDLALERGDFRWEAHLLLFLAKLLLQLGILPDEDACAHCGGGLGEEADAPLVVEHGGFACRNCAAGAPGEPARALLALGVRCRAADWHGVPAVPAPVNVRLMQFWAWHMHVKLPELASYRLLFQG